jgi:hypothetical protein
MRKDEQLQKAVLVDKERQDRLIMSVILEALVIWYSGDLV